MSPEFIDTDTVRIDAADWNPDHGAEVFIEVPDVGQGNPATALAIQWMLEADGIPSRLSRLTISSIPVRRFHTGMTANPDKSEEYTRKSEHERLNWRAKLFSKFAKLEMLWRNAPDVRKETGPRVGVFAQEHQLMDFTKEELARKFPGGVYLYVPDVFPKESALKVMREKDVIPLVWNTECEEKLQGLGLRPIKVEPVLPYGFEDKTELEKKLPKRGQYILIKASGSGMADTYSRNLIQLCTQLGYEYEIWFSDHVVTNDGEIALPSDLESQTVSFYSRLRTFPPTTLICYPSEMAMVIAAMGQNGVQMNTLCLPPRGGHEELNRQWLQSKGLIGESFDPTSILALKRIKEAYRTEPSSEKMQLGLGTRSLVDVIREPVDQAYGRAQQVRQ